MRNLYFGLLSGSTIPSDMCLGFTPKGIGLEATTLQF